LWRLFVSEEFARQAGTRTESSVEDVQALWREEDGRLGEGEAAVASDALELRRRVRKYREEDEQPQ
jgi:hypothetical protein